MTKITVTDANGTKTVDMVDDTMTLTSTGPAVWSIEADAGDRIQFVRQPSAQPLMRGSEPDVWLLPPPRPGFMPTFVWRAGGTDYELVNYDPELTLAGPQPAGTFTPIRGAESPSIRVNPPADAPDGAAYVQWLISNVNGGSGL